MPKLSKAALLRRYFGAFLSKDRSVMEAGLAEDFTFTSPYDESISRAAYFERCWPNSDRIAQLDIEKIFEDGEEAFVLYRAVNNEGKEFRNTEFFAFRGDRIASVQVFFGASYKDGRFVREA